MTNPETQPWAMLSFAITSTPSANSVHRKRGKVLEMRMGVALRR